VAHVNDGTSDPGRRIVNAAQPKTDWVCDNCGKSLRYYWTRCPNDGAPRPERD
jgi:hypothetical protein